jgi:hypothetical protein
MSSLSILAKHDKLDRDEIKNKQSIIKMTDDELSLAFKTLNIREGLQKFTRKERFIHDPELSSQKFCLHSFIPCKGATPDADGVYGWVKCRGTFNTQTEMNERSETIVRTFDSFHHLFHGRVGSPFPFSLDPRYVEETVDVDIRKKATKDASNDIKRLREEDMKVISEVKDAEQRLLDDVDEDIKTDPLDDYITKRVKRATLIFTLVETRKKLDVMVDKLKEAEKFVNDNDKKDPSLKEKCVLKYEEARKRAGIKDDVNNKENMVYYIMKDLPEGILDM